MLENSLNILTAVANTFAIIASGIAIYLFVTKRKSISSALAMLLNYSFQLTISELKEKLERLNDFNADDEQDRKRIEILMHETIGQLEGNHRLNDSMSEMISKAKTLISSKRTLTEPRKRAFVAEFRERLRHLNIENTAGGEP